MRKGKDPEPDPYLWLVDPDRDPGCLKNIRIPNTEKRLNKNHQRKKIVFKLRPPLIQEIPARGDGRGGGGGERAPPEPGAAQPGQSAGPARPAPARGLYAGAGGQAARHRTAAL